MVIIYNMIKRVPLMLYNFLLTVEFMLRHLQIEESEVPKMCLELYREYGTTMAGLKVKQSYLLVRVLFFSPSF